MNKKVKFGFFLLLTIALVFVAACSDNNTGGTEEQVEIRYAFWGIPEEVEVQEKIVEAFEAEHPHIKVQLDHISAAGEFGASILTQIAGGNAPDVFYAGEVQIDPYVQRDVLLDLMPYAEEDGIDFDAFFQPTLQAVGVEDGHMWAMPKDNTPVMMYYNKNMFDHAGLDYPEPGWTFADFENAAKALTISGDNGRTKQYGYSGDLGWVAMYPFIFKNNGDVMDDDGNFTMNSPEVIESLEFMKGLMDKGYAPTPEGMADMDVGPLDLFNSERAAMVPGGRWMAFFVKPLVEEMGSEWGVVPYPTNAPDAPTSLHFVSLVAPHNTEHPKEVWEFLKFYGYSKEAQKLNGSTGLGIPVLKEVTEEGEWLVEGEPEEHIDIYYNEFLTAKELPVNADWALLVDDIQWGYLDQYFRGSISIEEAVQNIDKDANAEIERLRNR